MFNRKGAEERKGKGSAVSHGGDREHGEIQGREKCRTRNKEQGVKNSEYLTAKARRNARGREVQYRTRDTENTEKYREGKNAEHGIRSEE